MECLQATYFVRKHNSCITNYKPDIAIIQYNFTFVFGRQQHGTVDTNTVTSRWSAILNCRSFEQLWARSFAERPCKGAFSSPRLNWARCSTIHSSVIRSVQAGWCERTLRFLLPFWVPSECALNAHSVLLMLTHPMWMNLKSARCCTQLYRIHVASSWTTNLSFCTCRLSFVHRGL